MVATPALGGGHSSTTGTINMRSNQTTSATSNGMPTKSSQSATPGASAPPPGPEKTQPQPNPNVIPLSARKSQALDMSTVERRGQPSAVPEPPRSAERVQGIEEAPTFRPTEEEFKDPMAYIRSIYEEGSKYGIAKIIPPDGWQPNFAIDTERFHFSTRKQELNMAEGGTRANITYLDALAKFHMQRNGTNLNRFPSVDKRPLDLFKLRKFVEEKGGFETVCKQKRWAEIGRDLGYSGKIMSSLSTSLKNSYQKWLSPYEDWLKLNKPSVLQQQEIDNGGPYTPSPAATPIKAPQSNGSSHVTSAPAMQASMALNARLDDGAASEAQPTHQTPAQSRPVVSSGFTAVNSGGFTAVNAPGSGFSAINATPNYGQHIPDIEMTTPTRSIDSPLTSLDNTPELRAPPFSLSASSMQHAHNSSPLKRQLSSDGEDDNGSQGENKERRSKRLRKDAPPTVTGSHMNQPRLPSSNKLFAPRDRTNETPGEKCETCAKGDDRANMVFCEDCKVGYHRWCLDPPLKAVPEEEWFCPRCLVCCSEFGFANGGIYSLREFQEVARAHKANHFKDKLTLDPKTQQPIQPTEVEIETEFWRLTESLEGLEPVEYGADIHSTTHGSGFPTLERDPYNTYTRDPWNLNILPLDKESLFRHIKTDICGMTVPWLYVGMCFSTFCWHAEDHYTYSANYQHFGATKTWYGIPAGDADAFESAMKAAVPDLFEQQPDLLFHLVTLLQPEKIKKAGVQVYALDQRAGQFVITFPRAYHAGFNHGFNFNEAVNFAPADWEPFGAEAIQRLQEFRRQPVFSHDELLFSAAQRDHTIKTAKWLGKALERTRDRELATRETFTDEYRKAVEQLIQSKVDSSGDDTSRIHFPFERDQNDASDEEWVCAYCKTYGFLSRFVCKKQQVVLCLAHAGKFECCEVSVEERTALSTADHVIQVRMTNVELNKFVQKIVDIRDQPEAWQQKFAALLEGGPAPALRNLKTLVTEGEKINGQWELSELSELRRFVDKCNEWVEEAMTYITRKQQNRRKNERAWRKSSSTKKEEAEEKERDIRNVDNIRRLLKVADDLSFECPELEALRDKATEVEDFRKRAANALSRASTGVQELDELIEEGKGFGLDMPEIERLEKKAKTVKWYEDAQATTTRISEGSSPTLQDLIELIELGKELGVAEHDPQIRQFELLKNEGQFWEDRVKELMAVEDVNFQQLDDLAKQATRLPVSKETLAAIDAMLAKQREAQDRIMNLFERSRNPDFRKRPMYQEVVTAMAALEELNSKPPGTLDLEREQKKHEDWMRRGKKLFGKTNAPLHILHQHMVFVEEKNDACLDLRDLPRMPVEPSSRANSPNSPGGSSRDNNGSASVRDVFCICRKPEAGMMIECEMCHEWYHGKCLKIARGKVKEDDKYTCPICDYRVKIPRDATRPKIEELEQWQDEIPGLPFQPEEEDTLDSIIGAATAFRRHVASYLNPLVSTPDDLPVQRFYLRKIEGCELLLAEETNFFRKQVHKWAPVAPNSPPALQASLSTRKPRPTKLQKQMKEMGVDSIEDLPEHMRPRQPTIVNKKKKERESIGGSSVAGADINNMARQALSVAGSSVQGGSVHNGGLDTPPRGLDNRSPAPYTIANPRSLHNDTFNRPYNPTFPAIGDKDWLYKYPQTPLFDHPDIMNRSRDTEPSDSEILENMWTRDERRHDNESTEQIERRRLKALNAERDAILGHTNAQSGADSIHGPHDLFAKRGTSPPDLFDPANRKTTHSYGELSLSRPDNELRDLFEMRDAERRGREREDEGGKGKGRDVNVDPQFDSFVGGGEGFGEGENMDEDI